MALALCDGFFVFVFGDGVGDDAGAGLDVEDAVAPDDGAEGDAGVHVAGEIEVADGAAVGAAAGGFEFVDDLHGADFGCAADGADGEADAEGVEGGQAVGEFAGDVAGDVHDVAVALDGHDVADVDGADFGNAADVVAMEVDEHDVLGTFLGVGEQFFFEGEVFVVSCAAWTGAGEGAAGDDSIGDAAENFGAGADQSAGRAFQIEHERGGVDDAEGAVDVERIGR